MSQISRVVTRFQFWVKMVVGNKFSVLQTSALRVHVAIVAQPFVTQHHRNGLELAVPANRSGALEMLMLPGMKIVGIMTHFPVEDPADIRRVLSQFNKDADWIIRQGKLDRNQILLHAAASDAILDVPEAHLDMVRPGRLLYGESAGNHVEYQPLMTFKSRVASVNLYAPGNTVTYDRTFVLQRESRLANIPLGYSDGLRRVFSNRGDVLIRGHRAPIVGRITMNTVMIDVTDYPDIRSGDEVVLFGRQGSEEITQEEVEIKADTILADLRTMWGNSNPKITVHARRARQTKPRPAPCACWPSECNRSEACARAAH